MNNKPTRPNKFKFQEKHIAELQRAQEILLRVFNVFGSSNALAAYMTIGAVLEEGKASEQERKFRHLRLNRPFPLSTGKECKNEK